MWPSKEVMDLGSFEFEDPLLESSVKHFKMWTNFHVGMILG